MKRLLMIFLTLFIINGLFSFSLLDSYSGNYVSNIDSRIAAMGGASVSGGIRLFDSNVNPANIGFLTEGFGTQLALGFIKNDDDRALPMYNSFDAYVDDATYVTNVNFFEQYALGMYYKKDFKDFGLSAALMYKPYLNFENNYIEEVRNNANSNDDGYPPIIAKNFIEGEGVINKISFSTAFTYKNFLSLGIEISQMKGDNNSSRRIVWSDFANDIMGEGVLQDSLSSMEREFEKIGFKIGSRMKVNRRFGLGLSYEPKQTFDVTGNINGIDVDDVIYLYTTKLDSLDIPFISDSLTYADFTTPSRIRFGFSYEPRNIMRTYFNGDVEFVKWTDIFSLYENELNFYFGVEHQLENGIPFRLGFSYQTEYQIIDDSGSMYAQKLNIPAYTVGSGFKLYKNLVCDVSVEFSKRQYETLDLFPDEVYDHEELWVNYQYVNLSNRGWENPDKVTESFLKLQTSLTFKW